MYAFNITLSCCNKCYLDIYNVVQFRNIALFLFLRLPIALNLKKWKLFNVKRGHLCSTFWVIGLSPKRMKLVIESWRYFFTFLQKKTKLSELRKIGEIATNQMQCCTNICKRLFLYGLYMSLSSFLVVRIKKNYTKACKRSSRLCIHKLKFNSAFHNRYPDFVQWKLCFFISFCFCGEKNHP